MRSVVNVLKDDANISDPTKRYDAESTFLEINGKLAYKCCCTELIRVQDPLRR